MNDLSMFSATLRATAIGSPIAIKSGASAQLTVGSCGPMKADSAGACSAIPAGYVTIVAHAGPHGMMTGENGSARSKWTNAERFRICSALPKQLIAFTAVTGSGTEAQVRTTR